MMSYQKSDSTIVVKKVGRW